MKGMQIYVLGCLLWAPVALAICSNSLMIVGASFVWAVFLWNSPKVSPKIKRFWRTFHKVNFHIINSIK